MPGLPSLFNHRRFPAAIQQPLLLIGVSSLKPWLSIVLACLFASACYASGMTRLAPDRETSAMAAELKRC